jgi:hypothetical protein
MEPVRSPLDVVCRWRELRNPRFNESNEDGIGRAMLDGIRFIQGALAEIDAASAVILRIG